jgi:hypothetical protein
MLAARMDGKGDTQTGAKSDGLAAAAMARTPQALLYSGIVGSSTMRCIAIVRFPRPASLVEDPRALHAVLEESVPRYLTIPGLLRKYFIGNASHGGGVYEWQSRAAAEAFHNEAWRERLYGLYGVEPQVEIFELHALVDNELGTTRIDA